MFGHIKIDIKVIRKHLQKSRLIVLCFEETHLQDFLTTKRVSVNFVLGDYLPNQPLQVGSLFKSDKLHLTELGAYS